MKLPFDEMSVRVRGALQSAGITTYAELASLTSADIRKMRNLGKKSLSEIKALLLKEELSLSVKAKPPVVLTENEKEVLKLRATGISYVKIGAMMNLCPTRVVQIEKSAIVKGFSR